MTFVDFGGRGQERPLSYSTVEKTFYSFFIYPKLLDLLSTFVSMKGRTLDLLNVSSWFT